MEQNSNEKTSNVVRKVGSVTKGTGTKYLGRGVSNNGKGISGFGVPLKGLGGFFGVADNGTELAGSAIKKNGKSIDNVDNNINEAGQVLKDESNTKVSLPFLKKKGIKKVVIACLLGAAVNVFISVIFIIVLVAPLMELGIIDISSSGSSGGGSSGGSSSGGFTSISDNFSHWIPIGSNTTSVVNGVTYASGLPQTSVITSYFSAQEDFRTKAHGGIDFGNGGNGPGVINVIASKSGIVRYPTSSDQIMFEDNGYYGNEDGQGFGNFVKIEHSDGTVTIYAHLSKNSITVFSGQTVEQGQVIGKMGHSGSSTGTHLHFEVRVNNNREDPLNYVSVSNPRP